MPGLPTHGTARGEEWASVSWPSRAVGGSARSGRHVSYSAWLGRFFEALNEDLERREAPVSERSRTVGAARNSLGHTSAGTGMCDRITEDVSCQHRPEEYGGQLSAPDCAERKGWPPYARTTVVEVARPKGMAEG